MAKRYVRFNITALKQVASNAVKSPCVSTSKLPEGLFNKVFLGCGVYHHGKGCWARAQPNLVRHV